VLSVLREAVDDCRHGRGPVFVEARTYRLGPHSAASDSSYMPRDEFDAALAKDPTPTFRQRILDHGWLDESRLDEIDGEVRATVEDAMEFARSSPPPAQSEVMTDVYADDTALRISTAAWRNRS
jgi:pyruvate dehydrogenase E1 component alpha subunit